MVSTGAPESSNCPPGSSEIAPPPVTSARPMMFGPSMIGSQPSRCLHADQQRADRALALIGHRIAPSV
jgi:hypothetical protein